MLQADTASYDSRLNTQVATCSAQECGFLERQKRRVATNPERMMQDKSGRLLLLYPIGQRRNFSMYDAIVVGARCGGSPTALLLARKGYRVLLVDKAAFPSDTMSGHYIWQPGVARLKRWGLLDPVIASNCPAISRVSMD